MKATITIPYPSTKNGQRQWSKDYGMNAYWAGKNRYKRSDDAKYWHALARSAANKCRIRSPMSAPVRMSFFFNDRLDLDNHAAMVKMLIDGLKGKVIADDSRRYVQEIRYFFHDEDCIKIIIEELGS